MKDKLDQYIMFSKLPNQLQGRNIEVNTKYRLKSMDNNYYYFGKYKINRDYLHMQIDYIKRERGRD